MASIANQGSNSNNKLDNLIIKLFKKGTTDEIAGYRRAHEKIAGTTEKQMMMAGVVKNIKSTELDEYDNMKSQYNLNVEYEKIKNKLSGEPSTKRAKIENATDQTQQHSLKVKEEQAKVSFWMTFKKYYSWFTGRKMHRELKDGKLVLTGNEDEHVLPFGFMLLFGGGIARVIDQEETKMNGRNPREIVNYLVLVQKIGMDPAFISYILTNDNATHLLHAMGYDNIEKRFNFCLLLHQINYYGYFLSEGKANTVKTNHLLIKLVKEDNGFRFLPSKTNIDTFIDNLYLWSQTMNYEICEALEKKMKEEDMLSVNTSEVQYYNINKVKLAYLPRGWRSSDKKWDPDVAKQNMTFILEKLCGYLNKDLKNRIFFNIAMSGIYLKEKIQKTLTTTAITADALAKTSSKMAHLNARSPNRNIIHSSPSRVMKKNDDDEEQNKNLAKEYFTEYLKENTKVRTYLNKPNVYQKLDQIFIDRMKEFDEGFFTELGTTGGRKKKKKRTKKKRRSKKKRTRRRKSK